MSLLEKLRATRLDRVPKGFKTRDQWAKQWDVHPQHAVRLIREALAAHPPLLVRKFFRVLDAGNRALRQPHYAEKK